jgi:hypothetical protein
MEQGPRQYSPDGQWWWDGSRWVSVSTGKPYSSSPTEPRPSKGWASEIPGLRYVPGFRTSTWWRALAFGLFYCIFGLFALISAIGHGWGAALFFGCCIIFAVAVSYAWTLRHRVTTFAAAVAVALLSTGGCLTGLVMSPTPAAQTNGHSSTTPPGVATVTSPVIPPSTSTPTPSASATSVANPNPVALPTFTLATPASQSPGPLSAPTPSLSISPTPRQLGPPVGSVDVYLSQTGPWIAKLNHVDDSEIESVIYWIRDAKQHWRSTQVVRNSPFETPINWWEGNNSGYEVITAHVTLRSGKTLKDPGGWHWVDGRHANPEGNTRVLLNSDDTAGATYAPALHGSVIKQVDFWLRNADDHWTNAGTATVPQSGIYSVPRLKGTDSYGWNGPDAAVSVHVVWPNGSLFVDPSPWAWSSDFVRAPAAPALQLPPTPPPTPVSPPLIQSPTPLPPTSAPAGCYPLTNSGNCYEPGEYCRNSDHGMIGRAGNGETIICRYNNGWRWEPA